MLDAIAQRRCLKCSEGFWYISRQTGTRYCSMCGPQWKNKGGVNRVPNTTHKPSVKRVKTAVEDSESALQELREWMEEARKSL